MALTMTVSPPTNNMVPTPWAGDVFVFPSTVGQQGFWYLDQLDPGNPAYNIAVRFRLQGPLQLAAMERALNEIVARHEALRTVVATVEGQPVQVVAPTLTIPIPLIDLRNDRFFLSTRDGLGANLLAFMDAEGIDRQFTNWLA